MIDKSKIIDGILFINDKNTNETIKFNFCKHPKKSHKDSTQYGKPPQNSYTPATFQRLTKYGINTYHRLQNSRFLLEKSFDWCEVIARLKLRMRDASQSRPTPRFWWKSSCNLLHNQRKNTGCFAVYTGVGPISLYGSFWPTLRTKLLTPRVLG